VGQLCLFYQYAEGSTKSTIYWFAKKKS